MVDPGPPKTASPRRPAPPWPASTATSRAGNPSRRREPLHPHAPWPTRWPTCIRRDDRGARRPDLSTEPAVPVFRDDAPAAGLRFTFENGRTPRRRCPRRCPAAWACSTTTATAGSTSTASRAAASPTSPRPSRPAPMGDRLFRNRGDGTFEDVTATAGIARPCGRGYGHGRRGRRLSTTTAIPTCSSPAGGRYAPLSQPGRRDLRGRRPRQAGLGGESRLARPPRPSPTSTTTATSTCMSAITSTGTRGTQPRACTERSRRIHRTATRARSTPRCPTTSSATTAAGSSTSPTGRSGIADRGRSRPGRRRRRPRR